MSAWDPLCSTCPSRAILSHVADKWALLVLGLLSSGPVRFNELRRQVEGISQKMLSQTLKNLERDGLVARQAFPTVPVTVEYSATDMGQTLMSTIDALRHWTIANADQVFEAQARYDLQAQAAAGSRARIGISPSRPHR